MHSFPRKQSFAVAEARVSEFFKNSDSATLLDDQEISDISG